MKYALIVMLLFVLVIEAPGILANAESTTVGSESLNVRSGPGLSYQVTASLKKDEKVEIVSTSGDWLEIKSGNKTGWIASWHTSNGGSTGNSGAKIVSNVNNLNVRSEPSTNSTVLGQMSAGNQASLLQTEGSWSKVHVDGMNGWVHNDYISSPNKNKTDKPDSQVTNQAKSFTVAVDALNVRQESDLTSKKVDVIYQGKTYKVKAIDGNWVQIEISQKKDGWVYSFHGTMSTSGTETVEPSSSPKSKVVNILSNGTNIRKEASTSSGIAVRANAGEQFEIISEVNEWYEVKLSSGGSAFVANWVVSVDNEIKSPVTQSVTKKARVPGTLKGLTIVIDPGHGGKDKGSTGPYGTHENNLTLQTSNLLADKLRMAGASVVLTRNSDEFVPLPKRVSISHQHAADAFISIHYDATIDPSVTGFTTYYTPGRQNTLARAVNNGLDSTLSIRNRGAQPGNYHVIRENRQNSILIELGFLSNPIEEGLLNSSSFREQATHGIYNGLLNYFNSQQ